MHALSWLHYFINRDKKFHNDKEPMIMYFSNNAQAVNPAANICMKLDKFYSLTGFSYPSSSSSTSGFSVPPLDSAGEKSLYKCVCH